MATKPLSRPEELFSASLDHLDAARAIRAAKSNSALLVDDEFGDKVLLNYGRVHVSSFAESDLRTAEVSEVIEGFKDLVAASEYVLTVYETNLLDKLFMQYLKEYGSESLEFMQEYLKRSPATDKTARLYDLLLEEEHQRIMNDANNYGEFLRRNRGIVSSCVKDSMR